MEQLRRATETDSEPTNRLEIGRVPRTNVRGFLNRFTARSPETRRRIWWRVFTPGLVAMLVVVGVLIQSEASTARTKRAVIAAKLVRIEPRPYFAGSIQGDPDETPRDLDVPRRAFWLGAYEVTQSEFQSVEESNPSAFRGGGWLPVDSVSWLNAVHYCNSLSALEGRRPYYEVEWSGTTTRVTIPDPGGTGYRLPFEWEWEFACRAGSDREYSFGSEPAQLDDYAWFNNNAGEKTHPVGIKSANALGLHDMHGNVWEWCWDSYSNSVRVDVGTSRETSTVFTDEPRVLRGGSHASAPRDVRSSNRFKLAPRQRFSAVGFRVARNAAANE